METTIFTIVICGQFNDLLLLAKELKDDFSHIPVNNKQETLIAV